MSLENASKNRGMYENTTVISHSLCFILYFVTRLIGDK